MKSSQLLAIGLGYLDFLLANMAWQRTGEKRWRSCKDFLPPLHFAVRMPICTYTTLYSHLVLKE